MDISDRDEFITLVHEMASMYKGTFYNDFFVSGYWRILKPFSMEAVRQACLYLLGDEIRKDVMPSAAEIKSIARRYEGHTKEETCIACQQPACSELVLWPPKLDGEHTMYCDMHHLRFAEPATLQERTAMAMQLSPKARAYLRSALRSTNPALMVGIPVTAEESEWTEPEERYPLAREPWIPRDRQAAQMYGVTPEEVKAAQANASSHMLEPLS